MNSKFEDQYKAGLRHLLAEKGKAVQIDNGRRLDWPESPDMWVSTYGWGDFSASEHIRKISPETRERYPDRFVECDVIIPEGVELEEITYSEFQDTFSDNTNAVGVNAYGGEKGDESEIRCTCGKYRGITLRFQGSLSEALESILGLDRARFTL